jgi:hypothetical protein
VADLTDRLGETFGVVIYLQEDVRIRRQMTEDSTGYALACADIDQDGFEDIIIGPYANPSQRFDAGIVYIIIRLGFPVPSLTTEP